jgi:putative transposase
MGTARYIFNKTVEYLKQKGTKADWLKIKTPAIHSLPEWAKAVPYQIKSIAVKEACTAVKNAKKKFKQTGKIQEVKFRSRRERKDSIFIPKSAMREESFYCTYLGDKIQPAEVIPVIKHDCHAVCEYGKYYLCVPVEKIVLKPENQRLGIVALDPGVRTFQTFYSPLIAGKLGESDFGRIYRLCHAMDDLISRMAKALCRQKRRMRKALDRIRKKIKDLIGEIHHKAARFLCGFFDVIIIPPFETSNMVTKLRSKAARAMLTWAHYRFKEFLKHKASEMQAVVIENSEAYTSKTCSNCGKIQNIGSKKIMRCSCGTELDRDVNGARGIFLRALADTPLLKQSSMHLFSIGNNS